MKVHVKQLLLFCGILMFSITGCKKIDIHFNGKPPVQKHLPANVAVDWYKLQMRIMLERNSAFNGNANFGYLGIGLYEAVRYAIPNSVSLSSKLNQMPAMPAKENNNGYNWEVSANAAMADMLRSFNTGLTAENIVSIDSLENLYNSKFKPVSESKVFERSQTFGKNIANAIHEWYLTDDLNAGNTGYVPPVFPGAWIPTPPAFVNPPVNPYFGAARTFLVSDQDIVAPAPITYSEELNSEFYKMVKEVYDVSKTLTSEQKDIALFWVDQGNGVGYTPPGHDFLFVTQAIEQAHADLGVAAEVFAKAGIAERDGGIVCFRSKYTYNLLRPVSYIQKLIDPLWLSFIPTPPHPEYPAAHAFITGSVMQAATRVLGDHIKVTDHSYDFRGVSPRTYSSIFAAGEEAGISRLYGGIHYHPSINVGLTEGKALGNRVGDIVLH
ncbi:MAG: vanadium-dependent haloperoxidase [Ginsengibacter sp.]